MALHIDDFAPVKQLLNDPRFRNMGKDLLTMQGVVDGPVHQIYEWFLLANEGERHKRLRRLVQKAFTPLSIDRLRPQMRETMHTLLNRVENRRDFDFVADIAAHFPTLIVAWMLGLQVSLDDSNFRQACADLSYIIRLEVRPHLSLIEAAVTALREGFEPTIAARRAASKDDLSSMLLAAKEDGVRLT